MNTSNQTSTHEDGTITSGKNLSCWFSSNIEPLSFEKLNENIDTDVLVIGGGISGLTTAYCLAKEGRKVVLLKTDVLEVVKPEEPQHILLVP
jgi:ribosomal protein S9